MKEYIEREASCKNCINNGCCPVQEAVDNVEQKIKEVGGCDYFAPSADVVEVRHGEWVSSLHYYGWYMCSECKCSDEKCQPNFDKKNAWKSCPNCGAKMDGGK